MKSDWNDSIQINYTLRDHEIVDYDFYALPTVPGIYFRGPAFDPDDTGDFFTCVGAAQTLGIYVERPYPTLLSERLGIPVLNLALGAVGPGFYLAHPELIDQINKGRFLILQVMSARNEASSRFEPTAVIEMLKDRTTGDVMHSGAAWAVVKAESEDSAQQYVDEVLKTWVANYVALLERIKVPVILFWYSQRASDAVQHTVAADLDWTMGVFPQFVDNASLTQIRQLVDGFAECASTRNTGHPLVSRFTGEPVVADYSVFGRGMEHQETTNPYYPSPEMHEDAAAELHTAIQSMARTVPALLPNRD